jgi:hypothetical protein
MRFRSDASLAERDRYGDAKLFREISRLSAVNNTTEYSIANSETRRVSRETVQGQCIASDFHAGESLQSEAPNPWRRA